MVEDSVFGDIGVEVDLVGEDAFLKVKETLTRMGVVSKSTQTLYQSAHILHKRGLYAILHFKELFLLDGKEASLTEEDLARRNTIARLLEEWGLVKIKDPQKIALQAPMSALKVIAHKDKSQWQLCAKYQIGGKRQVP